MSQFGKPSPPPVGEDASLLAAVPAYPSEQIEVSLKNWHKNWADLHALGNALKKLPEIIFAIQSGDMSRLMKNQLVRHIKNPHKLKKVQYRGKGPVYEIRPGRSAGPERVFFDLVRENINGRSKQVAYILWVDPHHEICE